MVELIKALSFISSLISVLSQGIIIYVLFSKEVKETPSLGRIMELELTLVAPLAPLATALALQAFLLSKPPDN